MEFPIILFSGENNSLEFNLKVVEFPSSVTLQYFLMDGTYFMSDEISQFTGISVKDLNSNVLQLIGPVERKIRFRNSKDFSNIFSYLKHAYNIKPSTESSDILLIDNKNAKDETPFKGKQRAFETIIFTDNTPKSDFGFSDNFTTDFIWKKPVAITPNDLLTLYPHEFYKSVTPFSVLNPELVTIASLWTNVLFKRDKNYYQEYLQLQNQWKTISAFQWKHSHELRNMIKKLEIHVERSILKSNQLRTILFNINISTHFYLNKMRFDETQFKFIELFMTLFIVGAFNENKVCLRSGETVENDEAAARIFFTYLNFYSRFIDQITFEFSNRRDLIFSIRTLLSKFCASISDQFEKLTDEEIDYVVQHFYKFLINLRSQEDVMLLISDVLTSSRPGVFFRCLICSSIKMYFDFLTTCDLISKAPFESSFDQFISNTNFRLFLYNSEMLHSHIAPFIVSAHK